MTSFISSEPNHGHHWLLPCKSSYLKIKIHLFWTNPSKFKSIKMIKDMLNAPLGFVPTKSELSSSSPLKPPGDWVLVWEKAGWTLGFLSITMFLTWWIYWLFWMFLLIITFISSFSLVMYFLGDFLQIEVSSLLMTAPSPCRDLSNMDLKLKSFPKLSIFYGLLGEDWWWLVKVVAADGKLSIPHIGIYQP